MKSINYLQELRDLDKNSLLKRILELKLSIEKARINAGFGKQKNHQEIRTLRKNLAQTLTILKEQK